MEFADFTASRTLSGGDKGTVGDETTESRIGSWKKDEGCLVLTANKIIYTNKIPKHI